jgi:UPF0271 protein
MHTIDINCDMGEGFSNDALLMPYISSANIACGYHAGDASVMQRTVELALLNNVAIGAHPGFADKANFGRIEKQLAGNEIYDLVTDQLYILQKITKAAGTKLHHIKPHGALYNMSAKDAVLAATIAKAVFDFDNALLVFGLSGSCSVAEAKKAGLKTASEVFADRTYLDNGSLTPRSEPNAMVDTTEHATRQVLQMIQEQTVFSVNNNRVPIIAETICIHGDGAHAVEFAEHIFHTLKQNGIGIQRI